MAARVNVKAQDTQVGYSTTSLYSNCCAGLINTNAY